MELLKKLRIFMFVVLLSTIVSVASSCKDDDNSSSLGSGTVTGVVMDGEGIPIAGATVTVSGIKETVSTGNDGKYTVGNVSIETHSVTFSKTGYRTISVTVTANKFDGNKVATTQVNMLNASAKISGIVTDGKNNNAPLAGVVVSLNPNESVTTGADGKYLLENLLVEDYTLTFTKANYVTITKTLSKDSFVDGMATQDMVMGGTELLRDLTKADLLSADKWYYNEYRGGGNADAYPHWDWACNYFSSMTFHGKWEEQWEGTTLQTRNSSSEQKNPADLEVFDSYTYGSKLITADNKIMSVRLRTHDADASSPAYYGVQVVDLSAAEPRAEQVGEIKTYGSGDYGDVTFDLSAYVGKEVIIAIGIYRKETGDYKKQLVLRAIRFADRKVENWDWLPGTEVVDGWKLTKETVRSTMPHTKKHFTGISPISGGREVDLTKNNNYPAAYQAWRAVSHIAHEWSFVPLKKDPEVFPSEGYLIKTRGDAPANTEVPESYYYAKFGIASGSNQLTLKTRNFGSNYTYFKLTAIKDDGTVTHIAPKSNTAQEASAAEDGCWKFKHGDGGPGSPEKYASFVYDLSQFNGNNVVLVFGIYNGVANSGENKLVFYSVDLK